MFTGNIKFIFDETSFIIDADYYNNLTVDYDTITDIEYRENTNVGTKYNGFNSARLLMGGFKNEEFGKYTRYTYTNCDACVVITSDDKTLIISGIDYNETKELYEKLLNKTNR